MPVTAPCRTPVSLESFLKLQIEPALKCLELDAQAAADDRDHGMKALFHALTYLGRSLDAGDICAFYLLHQIFVCVSRHDDIRDWPPVLEMETYANQKTVEAVSPR